GRRSSSRSCCNDGTGYVPPELVQRV
ncbi:uncharacterized protein METZ01_LOCUS269020, partial [marine metagenome]